MAILPRPTHPHYPILPPPITTPSPIGLVNPWTGEIEPYEECQAGRKSNPWTVTEKLIFLLLTAALAFLIGVQVGRNAEQAEARHQFSAWSERPR